MDARNLEKGGVGMEWRNLKDGRWPVSFQILQEGFISSACFLSIPSVRAEDTGVVSVNGSRQEILKYRKGFFIFFLSILSSQS